MSIIKGLSSCCTFIAQPQLWNHSYKIPTFTTEESTQYLSIDLKSLNIIREDVSELLPKKKKKVSSQTNAYFYWVRNEIAQSISINNFCNIEKSKQDANRQRRFISTRYSKSENARRASQQMVEFIESEKGEFIELGDWILKRDNKVLYYHLVLQIVVNIGKKYEFR